MYYIWASTLERGLSLVEAYIIRKLHNFPILSNKDSKKLYDLADLLSEIEAFKLDPKYSSILGYYDASSGVIPIVNKLPFNLLEMWVTHASNYKKRHSVAFPPFSVFCSAKSGMTQACTMTFRIEISQADLTLIFKESNLLVLERQKWLVRKQILFSRLSALYTKQTTL